MAFVNFKKGLLASLPNTYVEGTFYVTTDEHALYLDVSGSERIRISDFQKVANMAALPAASAAVAPIYYIEDINCLAVHNGSEWIQVNRDTGMTSVEVVGEGNAVTAAVYTADGRKLTLTKGATYMTGADVDTKINAKVGEIPADSEGAAQTVRQYIDAKTAGIATEGAMAELTDRVTAAEGEIDALQEKVGEKAVGTQIDEKIAALDLPNTYDAKGAAADAETNAKDYADGLAKNYDAAGSAAAVQVKLDEEVARAKAAEEANAAAAKDAQDTADAKVAGLIAADASVTVGGTSTNPTVAAKLSQDADNALELAEDGLKVVIPAAAEYSIVKAENSGEYAAIYNLTKDGAVVGGASINIPKDMVVESGSVVTDPEGQPAGTYIKLVLQNVAEPLFINVGSLIEYVTSGSAAGDMIVIDVSDDHKVTATITDGTITLAKLDTETQTKINKAHDHTNKTVLDGIDADKVAAWDASEQNAKDYADGLAKNYDAAGSAAAAQTAAEKTAADALAAAKTDLEGKITAAQTVAEKVANDNNAAMDIRVKALEAIDHDAYKAYADQAETDAVNSAKDYADGLAKNYDAAGAAATAEANAKSHAETLLTWGYF